MNTLLDVPAPAKLNLFLHIVGRRPDGYHLMQSVFVLLDLCDWLDFELRDDPCVTREDCGTQVSDPLPANDLVVRAAQLLQQASGCTKGAHIRLRKNIPLQAGMGGGSSDAASCLLALNRLWETGLNRRELMDLGLKLGADVPFFLLGDNAWAEGIGDKLHPIDFYRPSPKKRHGRRYNARLRRMQRSGQSKIWPQRPATSRTSPVPGNFRMLGLAE
jgi:4-diphosphocytidyl-2-C-methyl-D-erythritol kinase